MEVTSEILSSFEQDKKSKPSIDSNHVICKVRLKYIPYEHLRGITNDSDGDFVVQRKGEEHDETLVLEQSVSTNLQLVGLQLWRGALVLSDLVIHLRESFLGQTVLELGAGVGLTSVVAALYADHVICTDLDAGGILQLLKGNMARNQHLLKGEVSVRGMNWLDLDWSPSLLALVKKSSIVLAADVVYDNSVTEGFLKTVTKIMSSSPKTLYIALEKRYVFTIADLDTVAPCYEHLLQCMRDLRTRLPWSNWTMVQMDMDFPQRLQYERVPQMVLWKITS